MLVGVISDTHVRDAVLPEWLIQHLEGVDMILHAGDILDMQVVDQLSAVAETHAVCGNMDRGDTAKLPRKLIVNAGGKKIGLTHGAGAPWGMTGKVLDEFSSEAVDCIVFGHTHRPLVKTQGDILLFNPGTALDLRFSSRRTMGRLTVNETISAEIIDLGGRK